MRHILLIISTLLITTTLLGQQQKEKGSKSSWHDTTFILVKLQDTINDTKTVAVEIGKKAIIYLKLKPILEEAKDPLNDFVKDKYNRILNYFDSAALKSDTIFIKDYYNLKHFEYLISNQLIGGNAKVFYKKQKIFVDTISHRLERYGGNADRFFYLPDRRPFFSVLEFIGILDKNNILGTGHFDAYIKEAEKLRAVWMK